MSGRVPAWCSWCSHADWRRLGPKVWEMLALVGGAGSMHNGQPLRLDDGGPFSFREGVLYDGGVAVDELAAAAHPLSTCMYSTLWRPRTGDSGARSVPAGSSTPSRRTATSPCCGGWPPSGPGSTWSAGASCSGSCGPVAAPTRPCSPGSARPPRSSPLPCALGWCCTSSRPTSWRPAGGGGRAGGEGPVRVAGQPGRGSRTPSLFFAPATTRPSSACR